MKLKYKKTKVMLFNPCWSVDFMPQLEVEDHELELVEEMRLLGGNYTIRHEVVS